jgi:UDP-sugar transporter A1/2/3
MVWGVISLQALGGLIVALVVKRTDNLIKGFATSISIVLSCLLSVLLFRDVKLTPTFIAGALTVIGATVWYGWTPKVVNAMQTIRELDIEILDGKI